MYLYLVTQARDRRLVSVHIKPTFHFRTTMPGGPVKVMPARTVGNKSVVTAPVTAKVGDVRVGKGKAVTVSIPRGQKVKVDDKLQQQIALGQKIKAAGGQLVEDVGCHSGNCPPPPCPGDCPANFRDCNGVCGGSAFLDCNGICCSGNTGTECAVPDCNGICGGDAVRDCAGVCNGEAIKDCAGHCCGGNTGKDCSVRDCAGVCNGHAVPDCDGVCGGNKVRDCAGVCGGTSVPDCFGVCDGSAVPDCAGICDGPNRVDCAGVCGGCAVPDCMGVCGGHASYDCEGVCGGSHELDCSGQCCDPFGQYDGPACASRDCFGVCGGCAAPDCAGVCNGDHFRDCAGKCQAPCDDNSQSAPTAAVAEPLPKPSFPITAPVSGGSAVATPAVTAGAVKRNPPKVVGKPAKLATPSATRGAVIHDDRARLAIPKDEGKATNTGGFRYKK